MASIRKKANSKYWFACFTQANGSRVQRSTRETDRRKAQTLADTFEQAARRRVTARQAQRIIAEITGDPPRDTSIRSYFDSWLARKKLETASTTFTFYNGKARRFLNWLGDRCAQELFSVTSADVLAFRASEAESVSPSTVNHAIKFLRMVFEDAKRDGIISDNPADAVRLMKRSPDKSRRPFRLSEITRLLAVADDEWRSLIMFGLYTGQRLGDLARLTWQNVDLQQNEIRFSTSKTGRRQIIPLAPPLRSHVATLPAGGDPERPLHPRAFRSVEKSGKVGTLSRQFYELMFKAGLAPARKHRKGTDNGGRDRRRKMFEISFHALRHTATSLMKSAGVSGAIVQDIIGHESAAVSASYTHIDEGAKRTALSTLPDILALNDSR